MIVENILTLWSLYKELYPYLTLQLKGQSFSYTRSIPLVHSFSNGEVSPYLSDIPSVFNNVYNRVKAPFIPHENNGDTSSYVGTHIFDDALLVYNDVQASFLVHKKTHTFDNGETSSYISDIPLTNNCGEVSFIAHDTTYVYQPRRRYAKVHTYAYSNPVYSNNIWSQDWYEKFDDRIFDKLEEKPDEVRERERLDRIPLNALRERARRERFRFGE